MLKFQRDVHYSRGNKKLVVNVYVLEIRGRGDEIKVKKGYMATEGIGWSNVLSERNKIEEKEWRNEELLTLFLTRSYRKGWNFSFNIPNESKEKYIAKNITFKRRNWFLFQ